MEQSTEWVSSGQASLAEVWGLGGGVMGTDCTSEIPGTPGTPGTPGEQASLRGGDQDSTGSDA